MNVKRYSWNTAPLSEARGVFLFMFLLAGAVSARCQTPGGVSRSPTSWFKANTSVPGNIAVTSSEENKVTQWKSDVGDFSVSQPEDFYRPVYQPVASEIAKFNFNPLIQFSADNGTSLYNDYTPNDLLGPAGTIFLVSNQYPGSFFGPTGFTYYYTDEYRYQIKPSLVLQTGSNYLGWAAGLNSSAVVVNPAPDESAFILVSRSNEYDFTGRKNADSIPIVHNGEYEVFPSVSPGMYIGNDGAGGFGQPFNGGMGEVITFDTALTSTDVNKVESYLALKYGITLSQSSAYGADNSNYTASDGTQIWTAAANSTYRYDITGIGRDDASALMQKQSKSIQNNALVYLYNGSVSGSFPAMNTDNTSEINSDKSFLMVGDDGSTNDFTRCIPGTLITAMGRTWKVQKTGSGITTVTIALDASEVSPDVKSLIVSADPAFGTGSVSYPLSVSPDGKLYAVVTLNSNAYFTFGTDILQLPQADSASVCPGTTAALSVGNAATGVTYSWYADSTGGTALTTGSTFTTSAITANTVFYVEGVSSRGCAGTRTAVSVTVKEPLPMPDATFTSATTTSVTFSWSAVTGAASYQVSVNGDAAQTPSSGSTGLTHTVSGLAPSTTVSIAVTALGTESCETSASDTASGKTLDILPLTLVSFSGKVTGDVNNLYWQTSNEINTDYFNLEYSTDGQSFATVSKVWAGKNTYSSVHRPAQTAPVYYYRLQMMNTDGTFRYSSVVRIVASPSQNPVQVLPNPFRDHLLIAIYSQQSQQGFVSLYDMQGRKVAGKSVSLQAGSNSIQVEKLGGLGAGNYLLKINTSEGGFEQKVVKQNN